MPLTLTVEMHAYGDGALRFVEIPTDRLPQFGVRPSRNEMLGLAFEYGQNDFQPQPLPSVSVGDIIRLPDGTRHAVMGLGFREVPAAFSPPADGGDWTRRWEQRERAAAAREHAQEGG